MIVGWLAEQRNSKPLAESPSSFLTYLGKISVTLLAGYTTPCCYDNFSTQSEIKSVTLFRNVHLKLLLSSIFQVTWKRKPHIDTMPTHLNYTGMCPTGLKCVKFKSHFFCYVVLRYHLKQCLLWRYFNSILVWICRLPIPRPGEVLGLVGTNGIGKSTALKILAGKQKPNLGRFNVCSNWKHSGQLSQWNRSTDVLIRFKW